MLAALAHVADQPMRYAGAAVVAAERPEVAQLRVRRPRPRAEDRHEARAEARFGREARKQRAERRVEELLDESGPMRFGEQAAVQQADALDGEARLAPHGALVMPGDELLRDGVAVVVRQHRHARHTERCEQPLVQRRLVHDRVGMVRRLRREAEPDHVGRDHAVTGRQPGPQAMPVPRRGREAVDADDGRAAALVAVEDAMTAMLERPSGPAPLVERHRPAARAASIAVRSSALSGVTLLGNAATTWPSLPTRYLWKFHLGSPCALVRNPYTGDCPDPLVTTFSKSGKDTP